MSGRLFTNSESTESAIVYSKILYLVDHQSQQKFCIRSLCEMKIVNKLLTNVDYALKMKPYIHRPTYRLIDCVIHLELIQSINGGQPT
jgi:hypothetical protein